MAAAASLVGAEEIRADDAVAILGHEGLVVTTGPVGERVGAAHRAIEGVGLAGADHRLEDRPDRVVVGRQRLPDQHQMPPRTSGRTFST